MANNSTLRSRFRDFLLRDDASHDGGAALHIPFRSEIGAVGVNDALSLSNIYRAISIHTISVKQLSYDAYRGGVVLTPDQSPSWLKQPDINSTRSAFLEQTVVSLACKGNAYWLITRGDRGVTNLEVLNPLDVLIQVNSKGKPVAYSYQGTDYTPDQIQHLRLLRIPGTPYGLGPIQAAQRELRGAIDVRNYASNWFDGSGVPAGYLATEQQLNEDIAKQYRDNWTRATADREGVPVLGSGAKFVSTFLSPQDALWIEAQQFNVTASARLFGVPASLMLATLEGAPQTYANVAQDWLAYTRFSLMQYLTEIEDAFSQLLPRGTEAHFNIEALLRSDTATRYATYASAITAGWMRRSEVRAIENLPPIPGIDDQPLPPAPSAPTEAKP